MRNLRSIQAKIKSSFPGVRTMSVGQTSPKFFTFSEQDSQQAPQKELSPKAQDLLPIFSSILVEATNPYAQLSPSDAKKITVENGIMYCENGMAISITSTVPKVSLSNFKVKGVVRFLASNGSLCRGDIYMCTKSEIGNRVETEKYATISMTSE